MELIAEKRQILGKKTKSLRKDRKIPAVVFGINQESIPIVVDYITFEKTFAEAGETSVIDLKFDGVTENVLVKDIQVHPVTSQIMHVDFMRVDLSKKIEAEVPVEIIGRENNSLVKNDQALVLPLLSGIRVEALPNDLPSEFVVDVSNLEEVGQGVTIGELSYDREKVEILEHEDEDFVVRLDYAEMQEVEEEEPEMAEDELLEGLEATEETADDDAAEGEAASAEEISEE